MQVTGDIRGLKTAEEMAANVQNNPLMKKSGNRHGIESFDKITINDYRNFRGADPKIDGLLRKRGLK